jgi:hypothetical protein
MTLKIAFAAAVLLSSGVLAQYQKAPIPYFKSLDCTSCIRGGYNFCENIGGTGNGTVVSWTCEENDRVPNAIINKTDPGGAAGGWFCNRAYKDQMNAIVGMCRPWKNQNRNDDCGSYFVDVSEGNQISVGRSVKDLPVNSSCSYRVMSHCGYPQVSWRVNDPKIAEDFDFAWASMDGIQPTDELDVWNFDEMTDARGSLASKAADEYQHFYPPAALKTRIDDSQWTTCKGQIRNLWVSVTRVKDSDPQPKKEIPEYAARQLQFYPNGTKFADIDLTFSNY